MQVSPRRAQSQSALDLHTVIWSGLAVLMACAPLLPELPLWLAVISVMSVIGRWAIALRPVGGLILRIAMVLAALAGTAAVYGQFHTLLGREAGSALLVLMVAFKFLEARTQRDAYLVILLSYFLLLTNFFFSQSIPTALYALPAATVSTAALIHISQESAQLSTAVKLRTSLVMLLQSVPIALILSLLFPRLPGPLWTLPLSSGEAMTGLSDEMSPGSVSRLTKSDQVALRVSFEGPPPSRADMYWRGPVFWNFDGHTWRGLARSEPARIQSPSTLVYQTITQEPQGERWLLALDSAADAPEGASLDESLELLASSPLAERKTYRVGSRVGGVVSASLPPAERALALALPEDSAPRTKALAMSWRAAGLNDLEIARRAMRYFTEQAFAYTLTPPLTRGDPVDQFLFETHRGFCELYASSYTVLMRAAGIPARIVTGYLGGEWNPQGGYLRVLQADAHAWSEIWLAGRGWVRIDPTGAVSPERVEQGAGSAADASELPFIVRSRYSDSLLNLASLLWDNLDYQWIKWILAFDADRQRQLLGLFGMPEPDWVLLAAIMSGSVAAISLVTFAWYLAPGRGGRRDPLLRLYARLCARLARTGMRQRTGETLRDYVLRAAPGMSSETLQCALDATELYNRLRYGRSSTAIHRARLAKKISELRIEQRCGAK